MSRPPTPGLSYSTSSSGYTGDPSDSDRSSSRSDYTRSTGTFSDARLSEGSDASTRSVYGGRHCTGLFRNDLVPAYTDYARRHASYRRQTLRDPWATNGLYDANGRHQGWSPDSDSVAYYPPTHIPRNAFYIQRNARRLLDYIDGGDEEAFALNYDAVRRHGYNDDHWAGWHVHGDAMGPGRPRPPTTRDERRELIRGERDREDRERRERRAFYRGRSASDADYEDDACGPSEGFRARRESERTVRRDWRGVEEGLRRERMETGLEHRRREYQERRRRDARWLETQTETETAAGSGPPTLNMSGFFSALKLA